MEFVKVEGGLQEVDRSKLRNFANLDAVSCAIEQGILKEGDMFSTICYVDSISDDIAYEVYRILSYIPDDTDAAENQLVNQNQLASVAGDSVQCADYQTDQAAVDACLTDLTNTKVTCSDYNEMITNIIDSMNSADCCRVQCYDYNQKMTSLDSSISNLSSTKVTCSDYTSCISTLNTNIGNKVSCSDYNTKMTGLDNSISSLSSNKVTCSDYTSNCTCQDNRIYALEQCAGLSCTGTLTSSNFSLSGTTLTISF